ncbi:hypothetical protein FLJC2902T_02020 [Flavobacterium limnosediminis JC2902]|uniref:DUF4296 domain-containing protein n=1 Tax=Flavobacterium limnosediminis JC2902 TaxID=1341181 RepID=V6SSQ7_9FLAO|nr:DUF4296 domain-containing protein [Flavobacterium limnosediminis]ESU29728.1 hypothetical protein FLJC2902T_02020 [Flavobacterium limnosediminis JC2902]
MKKIALFFVLFAALSCGNGAIEKPENLLSEEMMVDILYDLTVLQSAENLNPVEFSQNNVKVNEMIYKKYNIDSISFAQSNRYYAADPHHYQKMFKKVVEKIEANKKGLDEQTVKETGKELAPTYTPAIQ